jgi:hypothetical protein
VRDPDFIEARATISALQLALDHAHARIRDNERIIAELNARLAEQTERCDDAEFKLMVMLASAPARVDATLPDRDVSP